MSDDIFDDLFGTSFEEDVVVVDDSESNLDLVSSILGSMGGVACRTFYSAAPALSYILRNSPSIVITDQTMGSGMTGVDLLIKIREKYDKYHLPVILMSDIASDTILDAAFNHHVNDVIFKPISRAAMTNRTKAQIEMAQTFRKFTK